MSMKWKQGDWEIHFNTRGGMSGYGYCLMHTGCTAPGHSEAKDEGLCSCSNGKCYNCKLEVPEEIKGFFQLVKWKR